MPCIHNNYYQFLSINEFPPLTEMPSQNCGIERHFIRNCENGFSLNCPELKAIWVWEEFHMFM